MAGNHEGGLKTTETVKRLYGKDFYKKIGAMGAAARTKPTGFAIMDKKRHLEISRIGGAIGGRASKRGKARV